MIPLGTLASARHAAGGGGALLEYVDSATSTDDLTTYSFNVAVGTHYSGREIVVGVVGGSDGNRSISSVSIDGVAAALDSAPYSGYMASRIARGAPTDDTATIVVTFSDKMKRCAVFVFKSSVPLAVGATSRNNGFGTSIATTNTPPSGSFVVVTAGSALTETLTFTNCTEVEALTVESAHVHAVATATGTGASTEFRAATTSGSVKQIHVVAYEPA